MITAVTVALVAVGALLVGLPLLAWWVGGRSLWGRLEPRAEPDVYRDMVQRYGLRPAESVQVEGAVTWGRELHDDRLRAAAVDWAQHQLDAGRRRRAARPRLRRWAFALLLTWGAVVVVTVGGAFVQGRWADVSWFTLSYWVVLAIVGERMVRGPQRAIQRNSGPARSHRSGS